MDSVEEPQPEDDPKSKWPYKQHGFPYVSWHLSAIGAIMGGSLAVAGRSDPGIVILFSVIAASQIISMLWMWWYAPPRFKIRHGMILTTTVGVLIWLSKLLGVEISILTAIVAGTIYMGWTVCLIVVGFRPWLANYRRWQSDRNRAEK